MRRSNNNNNNNRSRNNNIDPYSDIPNENPDGDDDAIPPYFLKLLGPLAPILLGDDLDDPEELQNRLRLYSLAVLGTSSFFWTWAAYNTIGLRSSGGFDLGVASFLGSGASSVRLLRSSQGGKCYDRNRKFGCFGKKDEKDIDDDNEEDEVDMYGIRKSNNSRGRRDDNNDPADHTPPSKRLRVFAALTQGAVVANYMLGMLFAFTAGTRVYIFFATYCFLFSMLWLIVAFSGWVLVAFYREALRREYGEEILYPPQSRLGGRGLFWGCLVYLTNRANGHSGAEADNDTNYDDDDDEEEDDIDEELRALYEGGSGYTA